MKKSADLGASSKSSPIPSDCWLRRVRPDGFAPLGFGGRLFLTGRFGIGEEGVMVGDGTRSVRDTGYVSRVAKDWIDP